MTVTFLQDHAPGMPGTSPTWCKGEKQAVETSLGNARVWFTIGDGILNEVYYPRIDIPQIRDLGFIVTDDKGFWVELKTIAHQRIEYVEFGVPSYVITHTHPRFTFTQRIVPDSNRDVILVETNLVGDDELKVFVLLAPHLGGSGHNDVASIETVAGFSVLMAEEGPFGLALAAKCGDTQQDSCMRSSAGYSGVSDAWQQFDQDGVIKDTYRCAGPGNVALSAEIARFNVLALAFASSKESAATLAISSLMDSFASIWEKNSQYWQHWRSKISCPTVSFLGTPMSAELCAQLETSAMVLRTHFDQTHRGALVASLSVPWGNIANERPGYHLVWPRDLVECAGALLAIGAFAESRDVLSYLIATQKNDGSWHQNQWLGGKPFWTAIQLDQVAFPVLLAGTLADKNTLSSMPVSPMARRAISFIIRNGPVTPQDRWEESSGINPFTLAVCIAALVSGARFLDAEEAEFALAVADYWNDRLEDWTSVSGTAMAKAHDVDGYYIKVFPDAALHTPEILSEPQPIKNRWPDPQIPANEQIAMDFLQLVRLGLRRADNPLILSTLKIADATLRKELPQGDCWYRYTEDGYGETENGDPYISAGRGRPWPLLVGERGHYEIGLGKDAVNYLEIMARMAGPGGMIPEQIWDEPDLPDKQLFLGRPTGSATPLVWAHAEYIKLMCSTLLGAPVDRPEPVWDRYRGEKPSAKIVFWTTQTPFTKVSSSKKIVLLFDQHTLVELQLDNQKKTELTTIAGVLDTHIITLKTLPKKCRCQLSIVGANNAEYSFVVE